MYIHVWYLACGSDFEELHPNHLVMLNLVPLFRILVSLLELQSLFTITDMIYLLQNGVLCPICKKSQLKQCKNILVCTCGDFRFDTKDDQVLISQLH